MRTTYKGAPLVVRNSKLNPYSKNIFKISKLIIYPISRTKKEHVSEWRQQATAQGLNCEGIRPLFSLVIGIYPFFLFGICPFFCYFT